MKTKHLLITALTATGLAMGSSQALAASFLIDNFDIPLTPPANTPLDLRAIGQTGTQFYTGLDPNQVIGGNRTLQYTLTDANLAPGNPRPRAEAEIQTGGGNFDGLLNIENSLNTTSVAEIEWTNIFAQGQGNFNTLQGDDNQRGIAIDTTSDGIPFYYTLIISDGMNMSTVTKNFDFDGDNTQTKVLFSYADILGSSMNTGLDLSMVNYVKLVIGGNLGYDVAITQIGSFEVPEPSTVLGLLAVLGTGAFSIKRKKV